MRASASQAWFFGLVLAGASAMAQTARAHPELDAGIRHYEEAAFERAIEAFARAEQATDLTRAEVVLLLRSRATVHFALEDAGAMRADLARLAALDPDHLMGPQVPPQVRAAFDAAAERATPLRLELRAAAMPGGRRIESRVVGDPGGLSREVRLRARAAGGGWVQGTGTLEVPAAAGAGVEYWAELVGIGGAVLATHGSEAEPVRSASDVGGEGATDGDEGGGAGTIILVTALAAVALAAVVVAVLVTSGGTSDDTQFGAPSLGDP